MVNWIFYYEGFIMVSMSTLANDRDKGFLGNLRRPKVTVVHIFPKGCGVLASTTNSRRSDHHAKAKPMEKNPLPNSTSRKYPPRRILKGISVLRDFPFLLNSTPRKYPPRKILEGVSTPRKYPPRKILEGVSVQRDFPVGCGNQSLEQSFHLEDMNKSPVNVKSKSIEMVDVKPSKVYSAHNFERNKVKVVLNLFREMFYKLMREHEANSGNRTLKFLLKAAMILQRKQKWINTENRLGSIPGVELGDEFHWMSELPVIGLHHQFCNGIDCMKLGGKMLATSVVDSGRYVNEVESCDVLIYSGQGGNPKVTNNGEIEDQKLERGNLALKNSMEAKTPVRVIRKMISKGISNNIMYVYDGLFFVDDYWKEMGPYGKLVFKFVLRRYSGKNISSLEEMSESKQSTFH